MKYPIILVLCASAGWAAGSDSPSSKSTAHKKTKASAQKSSPGAQGMTIPKDAVANPDGTYAYTDKEGKKWLYAKTPFGVTRGEDHRGSAVAPAGPSRKAVVTATDNGDTVKFVRQTPFGPMKWEKKKADLTDEERQAFEGQQAKPVAEPDASQSRNRH
jgi:hypothetical protein